MPLVSKKEGVSRTRKKKKKEASNNLMTLRVKILKKFIGLVPYTGFQTLWAQANVRKMYYEACRLTKSITGIR